MSRKGVVRKSKNTGPLSKCQTNNGASHNYCWLCLYRKYFLSFIGIFLKNLGSLVLDFRVKWNFIAFLLTLSSMTTSSSVGLDLDVEQICTTVSPILFIFFFPFLTNHSLFLSYLYIVNITSLSGKKLIIFVVPNHWCILWSWFPFKILEGWMLMLLIYCIKKQRNFCFLFNFFFLSHSLCRG